MLPLKKPLLDPSWLLFHRFSWISEDFMRFYGFPWISRDFMDFHRFRCPRSQDVCKRNDSLKETFTRSQLAAVSSIFMDFRGFHRFIDSSNHRIWRLGWLARLGWAGWLAISSIFIDFRGFHEISWIPGVGGQRASAEPLQTRCCP